MYSLSWLVAFVFVWCLTGPAAAQAQTCPPSDRDSAVYTPRQVDKKARVTYAPSPELTEDARRRGTRGTVVLQIVLEYSGSVGKIRTISGLPDGLTEAAINACRKLEFDPAIKDGCPVSQYLRIEYNFL